MHQIKPLSALLKRGSPKLSELRQKIAARERVLACVRATVAPELAAHVVSAGCEAGKLTIGTPSSAWASRLRYVTDDLKKAVASALGLEIESVRIKIVAPPKPSEAGIQE
jgi:predicted nucleic acid-binding Zn ribbon protein